MAYANSLLFSRRPYSTAAKSRLHTIESLTSDFVQCLHTELTKNAVLAHQSAITEKLFCYWDEPLTDRDIELLDDIAPNRIDSLQCGESFSCRFVSAISELQAAAPEAPIIVTGSDIPTLSSAKISEAAIVTQKNPSTLVIGLSREGGFYLTGIPKGVELDSSALQAAFSKPNEAYAFRCCFPNQKCYFLSNCDDIDTESDLVHHLSQLELREDYISSAALSEQLRKLTITYKGPGTRDKSIGLRGNTT